MKSKTTNRCLQSFLTVASEVNLTPQDQKKSPHEDLPVLKRKLFVLYLEGHFRVFYFLECGTNAPLCPHAMGRPSVCP